MEDQSNPSSSKKVSRLKLWGGRLVILIVLLVILEVVLRFMGYRPGFIGMGIGEQVAFQLVDSLEVRYDFYTDSDAIFKANYAEQEKAFFYDTTIQINSDGFRDAEFTGRNSTHPKILLIGDSFTWGGNAKPIDQSFADLLRGYGYDVYNTGIPGADPNQYELVAQKYIPTIQPDQVVVCFYMANDVMYRDFKLYPNANRFHITNAGYLDPYSDGDHMATAQETYDYLVSKYSIPEAASSFNAFMASTVVTSQIWRICAYFGWVEHTQAPHVKARIENDPFPRQEEPFSYRYLSAVKTMCDTADIPFHLCLIPVHTAVDDEPAISQPDLFKDMSYHFPHALERSDYFEWPDGHLNNEGHQKYATFLNEVLSKTP